MELEDIATVAAQIFDHVSQYPREPRPPLDPTLVDAKDRQHEALLGAVAARAGEWTEEDRTMAAAVLRRALERGRLRAPGRRLGRSSTSGPSGASPGSSDWSRQAVRDGRGPDDDCPRPRAPAASAGRRRAVASIRGSVGPGRTGRPATVPPSTGTTMPVIWAERSPARKRTASATSSGDPWRCSGWSSSMVGPRS